MPPPLLSAVVATAAGKIGIPRAAAMIPFHAINYAQQQALVIGELLERADFAARADYRDQIVWLEMIQHQKAKV
ncbi:MAG TPA: hypothetical protein VF397_12800 [Pyrinomonadaceae bacterium]